MGFVRMGKEEEAEELELLRNEAALVDWPWIAGFFDW